METIMKIDLTAITTLFSICLLGICSLDGQEEAVNSVNEQTETKNFDSKELLQALSGKWKPDWSIIRATPRWVKRRDQWQDQMAGSTGRVAGAEFWAIPLSRPAAQHSTRVQGN